MKCKTEKFERKIFKSLPAIVLALTGIFALTGCGQAPKTDKLSDNQIPDSAVDSTTSATTTAPEKTPQTTAQTSPTTKKSADSVDGMRPDFKSAMDSYEAFIDEYVAFMKKYNANPSDLGLIADYAKYMSKYSDMVDKFDEWENEDLNNTELAYYIDVQSRVTKKMLEVAN